MARLTFLMGLGLLSHVLLACQSPFIPTQALSAQGSITANNQQDFSPTSQTTWAFEPAKDTYDRRSLLDLRYLNEAIAGESGFVKLATDRESFVKGNGKPLRFWGVNVNGKKLKYEQLQDQARFLAKRGVNLVRLHESLAPKTPESKFTDSDRETRDRIWRTVAAMKQAGIYVTISPYWAYNIKPQPDWPVPKSGKSFFGLLFFDPELQAAYKAWWRALLEPVNPYTSIALKDEPAIAYLHLQNEDSLLFWTMQQLQGQDLNQLSQQYGQWLQKKYGSLAKAQPHWGKKATLPTDNLAAGQIALYSIDELTKPVNANTDKGKRLADQTQFLTETMAKFNRQMVELLREDVGAKQLINANNWRTASTPLLNDAERYSYTPTEIIGVNRYYNGGGHEGKKSGWAILNGDRFSNQSVLFNPLKFPLTLKQVSGHPMIVSEGSWVPPLGYQSEGPLLISAYRSLLGIDGFDWFTMADPQWRQPASANGHLPSLGKWVINTPELLGNFPAAALLYRQGYVQSGQTIVQEQRSLADLWQRQPALITEESGFDPNRDRQPELRGKTGKNQVNPLAFLVGPVQVRYGVSQPRNQVGNLTPYLQTQQKQVRSITGEMNWNYGQGLFTLDSPQAQAVTGFLRNAGPIQLTDVAIASKNHYATAIVVSLDGKAIKNSQKLLVEVGTEARPTQWQQRPATWQDQKGKSQTGFEVINYGQSPWRIVNYAMTFTLNNSTVTTATALDLNGMATNPVPLQKKNQGVQFVFPPAAKYLLLTTAKP
ncbi:MAG: hypothetical protein ACK58N_08200 [Synechocystis sp.]